MRGLRVDIVIATPRDIAKLRSWVTWLDRPAVDTIHIALPTLGGSDASSLARELTRNFNDCGCGWAATAFAATVLVTTTTAAGRLDLGGVAVILAAATLAGVVAKLLALAWSYWRLRTLLDRL